MQIILIGMMATFKSSAGVILAQRLGLEFFDCDTEYERIYGERISDTFKNFGEKKFRQRETTVLKKLIQNKNAVISTGGGVVLCYKNRNFIKNADIVIQLTASSEAVFERVKNSSDRPLLVDTSIEKIQAIYEQRKNLYQACQTNIIDTTNSSPESVATKLLEIVTARTGCLTG